MIEIKNSHPEVSAGEARRLIRAVLEVPAVAARRTDERTFARIMPGGFSGAIVMLVWITGLDPIIVKAGSPDDIRRENDKRREYRGDEPEMVALGLAGVLGPVDVEVGGESTEWTVICYRYIGGLTYHELDDFGDFARYLERFVRDDDPAETPSWSSVRTCLYEAARAIVRGQGVTRELQGRPLATYLPDPAWDRSIRAALTIAQSLWPDMDELRDFPGWFEKASDDIAVAPVADNRLLHGDARLANVLVDAVHAHVHLIDFGNARTGHVFEDLARFELDLILTTAPRHPEPHEHELIQDDLVAAFQHALGDNFGMSGIEVDTRHSICLQLWRQALGDVLGNMSLYGAPMMYRWFLLVECLRRLRWIADNGPVAAGVDAPSLLNLIGALRRRLSGDQRQTGLVPLATPSDGLRVLSCDAVFVPSHGRERSVNEKRNAAKARAVADAAKKTATVRVLAETGYSFLADRGILHSHVRDLLEAGGSLQVVVSNPSFVESFGISASYLEDSVDGIWHEDVELVDDLRFKFGASFEGLQHLKNRYGRLVEARIARFGIGSTMLITQDVAFFEPYFRSMRRRRQEVLFDTFEFEFLMNSPHIRTLIHETFDFHWRNSNAVEDMKTLEERWRAARKIVFRTWWERNSS